MTDQQRHIDRAVRELAARLTGWATGMKDPRAFAQHFMDDLVAEHWRCIPPPPPIARRRQADPETAHRGAQLAREALRREDET